MLTTHEDSYGRLGLLDLATFETIVKSTPLVSIDLCLVFEGRLLMGLRNNEPLKDRWFTPGGRVLKNERWQDALARIARAELGMSIDSCEFNLMGIWDHFYPNSAVGLNVSTHYVNLPHLCHLTVAPDITRDGQHKSVRWFDVASIINNRQHHSYMREYAAWIHGNANRGACE